MVRGGDRDDPQGQGEEGPGGRRHRPRHQGARDPHRPVHRGLPRRVRPRPPASPASHRACSSDGGGAGRSNPAYLLDVARGDELLFSCDEALATASSAEAVYMDYADIGTTLSEGDIMMVDDGLLEFEVTETGDGW